MLQNDNKEIRAALSVAIKEIETDRDVLTAIWRNSKSPALQHRIEQIDNLLPVLEKALIGR